MKLPLEVENLMAADLHVVDAVAVEHNKAVDEMTKTLRGFGWSPMQCAYAEDHWSWSWIARAIITERHKRGLPAAPPEIVAAQPLPAHFDRAEPATAEHLRQAEEDSKLSEYWPADGPLPTSPSEGQTL